MSHRRDLERHRHKLGDMREIMNSMKVLAYMETRKLSSFITCQRNVLQSIETAANDFLYFYPGLRPPAKYPLSVCLVVGSERGFCGDFNRELLEFLPEDAQTVFITVGHKLNTLLLDESRVMAAIPGANVAEEIGNILENVAKTLMDLQRDRGACNISVLFHSESGAGIQSRDLLPPFQQHSSREHFPREHSSQLQETVSVPASRPLLNLSPFSFFSALIDQYLFAALNTVLYDSLMAENNLRVRHLDAAVKHLDDKSETLGRRCNAMRQEEITEEIEVILLSAENKWIRRQTSPIS